ncbi:MAG TPA: sulfatase, partial [Verrucomicrobiales bacterium]|nr:sulfatase [Verrucomicrobiales bacterium]
HLDLFDPKPGLKARFREELPDSIRGSQRLTGMTSGQKSFPIAPSPFAFRPAGQSGLLLSELLPHTARVADELCLIRSMHTEAINHDPAITFFCSGNQVPGRPSMGAWASYGLGSLNNNLPSFIVLVSKNAQRDQPLYSRLWGSGFLPSEHQGVQFRSGKEPVLYLTNPEGVSPHIRRNMLDTLGKLNRDQADHELDPEVEARIAQAEMAFRMQTSVPDATDLSGESEETLNLYGPDVRSPGSYAANCLLARRLIERDVRFVQLFHQGWDQHGDVVGGISRQCQQTDQASAALIIDLKRRGLLDDTLVVWGGEFGRTAYCQGKISANNYGRDHHPRCFSIWLAGAGIKAGMSHGLTDEYGYNILDGGVHVHDLHATMLHLMGVDHEKLVYKFQGRYYRLTDVHGNIVKPILA